MNIGIVGLGLIGGSLAKSYKRKNAHIAGDDRDKVILDFAIMQGIADEEMTDENIKECEVIFLAVPPVQAVKWMEEKAPLLSEHNIVIDCCGTKRKVCSSGFALSDKYGFRYAGGHPMAGLQYGGLKNSREDLYDGATFVVVPKDNNDLNLLNRIKEIILQGGFSKIVYCTPEKHDKIIAFTSQMAHIVSNAFVKSNTPREYGTAVSAGSYRDFTRVAYLDADMWTELFMENRDNLAEEIHTLCNELQKYADALEGESSEKLKELLEEGKKRKTEVDNKWN